MKLSYLPAALLLTLALPVFAAPGLALAQAPSPPVPPTASPVPPPMLSVPGPPAPQPTSAPPPPAGAPPPGYPPPPGAPGSPPTYYSPPPPAGAAPAPGAPPGYPPPPPGYSYAPAPASYPAPPPPPPVKPVNPGTRLHNGFYLRVGFGITAVSGSIETPATTTSSAGVTTRTGETARAKISGPGGGFDFAMGATVFRGLAIAGNLSIRTLGSPDVKFDKASTQARTFKELTASNVGVMADWYIDPKKGLHVQGGAGIASVNHSAPSVARAPGSSIKEDARYSGLGLHLGVGYETFVSEEWGIGGLLRIDTASVESDSSSTVTAPNTSITLFAPSLVFTGTYN